MNKEFKQKFDSLLFQQVNNSPLIVFRILFGLLIFLESGGAILTGWVKETFVDVKVPLTFIGFEWLQPLPGIGMYFYYGLMAVLGLMVMVGLFYRVAMGGFTIMWWGCYLMQKSHYNNHYYLLILLCFLMWVVPAHQYCSLDVKRNPSIKSLTCPRWCKLVFILQLWIVFTFAAIAKINPDWLMAKPLEIWFRYKTDYPVIGPLFALDWFKWFIAYGGIFYDLLIVPLLLWRQIRLLGFFLTLFFHLFNSIVFQIGIFPYLMIAFTVFFFPEDKISRIFFRRRSIDQQELFSSKEIEYSKIYKTLLVSLLCIHFSFQIFLPLRHFLFRGNVHWTEEGHRMAWHMMLRTKSGSIDFYVQDLDSGERKRFDLNHHFSNDQLDEISKRPDMIWQAVQHIKKVYSESGKNNIEVYAHSKVSLNGGEFKPLVDPTVDLAKVKWERFAHSKWILLDE